jgi:transcriptional regulator with XRE-family HTH domain
MFEIGKSLAEVRTQRGLSPEDVEQALHIRQRYVAALEEERWDVLPGDAYAWGFLRSYADFLGLDGQRYADAYRRFAPPVDPLPIPEEPPRRPERRRLPVGAAVAGLSLLAAGTVMLGRGGGTHDRNPVTAGPLASVVLGRHFVGRPAPPARQASEPKPSAVIRATGGDCWVSVRIGGPQGREIYSGILNHGDTLRYGTTRRLWLRMGRPSELTIRIGKRVLTGLSAFPANLVLTRHGSLPG